jgi:hypothetical protein
MENKVIFSFPEKSLAVLIEQAILDYNKRSGGQLNLSATTVQRNLSLEIASFLANKATDT